MLTERTNHLGETTSREGAGVPQARPWAPARHHRVSADLAQLSRIGEPHGRRRGMVRRNAAARAPTVVVYHHLSATPHALTDGLEVSTDPEMFRRHIKYFARHFDLIGPADLLAGALPKKPLLITFDDVYRSVLDVGGPILREAKIQALWFMNPGNLEPWTIPLDNLLALAVAELGSRAVLRLLGTGATAFSSIPALISDYLPRLHYARTAALKAAICDELAQTQGEIRQRSQLFINAHELGRLPDYGIYLGNHSLTHSYFRSLSTPELQVEIGRSREFLELLSGQSVTCLAIPYGNEIDATGAALAVARASGHRATFLVHGRSNAWRPHDDVFYRICADRLRAPFLPVSMEILPRLRTLRSWMGYAESGFRNRAAARGAFSEPAASSTQPCTAQPGGA